MLSIERSYDTSPYIEISQRDADCAVGWNEIAQAFRQKPGVSDARTIVIECYPGANIEAIATGLSSIFPSSMIVKSQDAFLDEAELYEKFQRSIGDDPVFAVMNSANIEDFFSPSKLAALRQYLDTLSGTILVIGTGAALIIDQPELLIYADLARWEIQRRQRNHEIGNLGLANENAASAQLYKRAFFLDWRAADRLKKQIFGKIDFFLDVNSLDDYKMIDGDTFRDALRRTCLRPFRVAPFFDPGPWGGHWMKDEFGLPENGSNYAWCFDCVPEENSMLLGFGSRRLEMPAINLVLFEPAELLGTEVYRQFGAEFPIRFDYLDTVGGGNLSLQVHPLRAYIREQFGMDYTQDESYYIFQSEPDATVYLGLKENVDRDQLERELRLAQSDPAAPFPAENYVNIWPAKRHDHFLIPAGTIHCSGRNSVVLEISATPYIFTFKLWDWGRAGLDGKPRPVHLGHGIANIQWDRTTKWVQSHVINRIERLAEGDGWIEERTGLHELEFIETRRHWFTKITSHHTEGTVNVLNLVEGIEVIVESPSGAFSPFHIHYGETFIIPAAVGAYTIRPAYSTDTPYAIIKAFVRKSDG